MAVTDAGLCQFLTHVYYRGFRLGVMCLSVTHTPHTPWGGERERENVTVSKATLEKLLRDAVERTLSFPSA